MIAAPRVIGFAVGSSTALEDAVARATRTPRKFVREPHATDHDHNPARAGEGCQECDALDQDCSDEVPGMVAACLELAPDFELSVTVFDNKPGWDASFTFAGKMHQMSFYARSYGLHLQCRTTAATWALNTLRDLSRK
ncbi:MAG: hypothetical protein EPN91_09820 [Salinibacterium sp.]|nr:MAG: hypothetical protein EPN91_09820 [Salinibacterium sp.]